MAPALSVSRLSKAYGDLRAVDDVTFAIEPGAIFGLLGPNGAGKTTTVECAIGLRRPDGGEITIDGIDARRQPRRVRQRIGVALQSTMLPEKITPREALGLFGSFYERQGDADELLERFALVEKARARFETLSAGQRQRLAVALAMVNQPDVIVLDEPTAGLDPQSRRQLHEVITDARADGKAILLTTHYIDEAQELCDQVAIMDHGRIIASGRPAELIAHAKAAPKLIVTTARPLDEQVIRGLPGVMEARIDGVTGSLRSTTPTRTIVELVKLVESSGNELSDLHIRQASLEDLFIELTGRALRD